MYLACLGFFAVVVGAVEEKFIDDVEGFLACAGAGAGREVESSSDDSGGVCGYPRSGSKSRSDDLSEPEGPRAVEVDATVDRGLGVRRREVGDVVEIQRATRRWASG